MTEQEIRDGISSKERQINSSYTEFVNIVRSAGGRARDAAEGECKGRIDDAATKKWQATTLPLLISVFGFFLLCANVYFWGILMIVGGIYISFKMHWIANEKYYAKKRESEAEIASVDMQQRRLNNVLDNNKKI